MKSKNEKIVIHKSRFEHIDILKAIGIISIVIGHACNEYNFNVPIYIHWLRNYVYSYHLVIFCFCSGFLISNIDILNLKQFATHKIKTLYFEFVKYALILLIIRIFIYLIGFNVSKVSGNPVIYFLNQFIRICCFINGGDIDGPLWFLQLLFIALLIFYAIMAIGKKKQFSHIIICLLLFVLGIGGSYINQFDKLNAFRIDAALLMQPVIGSGYYFRYYYLYLKKDVKSDYTSFKRILVFFCAIFYQVGIIIFADYGIDIAKHSIGSFWKFYMTSFVGIVWCILLSQFILKIKIIFNIFSFIGKNSLYVMAFHLMVFKVVDIIYGYIYQTPSSVVSLYPYSFPELRITYVFFGILIPCVGCKFIHRKYENLFSKSRRNHENKLLS